MGLLRPAFRGCPLPGLPRSLNRQNCLTRFASSAGNQAENSHIMWEKVHFLPVRYLQTLSMMVECSQVEGKSLLTPLPAVSGLPIRR